MWVKIWNRLSSSFYLSFDPWARSFLKRLTAFSAVLLFLLVWKIILLAISFRRPSQVNLVLLVYISARQRELDLSLALAWLRGLIWKWQRRDWSLGSNKKSSDPKTLRYSHKKESWWVETSSFTRTAYFLSPPAPLCQCIVSAPFIYSVFSTMGESLNF